MRRFLAFLVLVSLLIGLGCSGDKKTNVSTAPPSAGPSKGDLPKAPPPPPPPPVNK